MKPPLFAVLAGIALAGCQSAPRTPAFAASEQTLRTAAASMNVLQAQADVIAHNLANSSTPGFRASRVRLQELPGTSRTLGDDGTIVVGSGLRSAGLELDMSEGQVQVTGRTLDLAISGEGFFRVVTETGGYAYTRAGDFSLDSEGSIARHGCRLEPSITIPQEATSILIDSQGIVSVSGNAGSMQVGQIQLIRVVNPGGLRPIGDALFVETSESGGSTDTSPGLNGSGQLCQGSLELSNVNVFAEQVELLRVHRAMSYWQALIAPEPSRPRRAVATTAE